MSGQSWIHKQRKQAVHVQTDSSFLQDRAVMARRSRSAEVIRGHKSPDLSESRSSGDRSRSDLIVRYVAGGLDDCVRGVSTPSVIIIGLGGPSRDSVSHTHTESKGASNEARVHRVSDTQSNALPGEHTQSNALPGEHTQSNALSNINHTVIIDNDRDYVNCDTKYECHCHQRRQCYHECPCHREHQYQQECHHDKCCQCQERRWRRDSGSNLREEGSMRQPRAITGYRGCQSGLHGADHRRGEKVGRVRGCETKHRCTAYTVQPRHRCTVDCTRTSHPSHRCTANCTRTSHPSHRCTANCTRTSHPRHMCTATCTGSVHPRHRCTVDCTRLPHSGRRTREGRVTKPGKVCTSARLKVKVSKQGKRGVNTF